MFLDRAPGKSSNEQDDMTNTRDFDGVRTPYDYDSSHGQEETDKRHDGPGRHDSSDTGLQLTDRTVIHVNLLILLSICKFQLIVSKK